MVKNEHLANVQGVPTPQGAYLALLAAMRLRSCQEHCWTRVGHALCDFLASSRDMFFLLRVVVGFRLIVSMMAEVTSIPDSADFLLRVHAVWPGSNIRDSVDNFSRQVLTFGTLCIFVRHIVEVTRLLCRHACPFQYRFNACLHWHCCSGITAASRTWNSINRSQITRF